MIPMVIRVPELLNGAQKTTARNTGSNMNCCTTSAPTPASSANATAATDRSIELRSVIRPGFGVVHGICEAFSGRFSEKSRIIF